MSPKALQAIVFVAGVVATVAQAMAAGMSWQEALGIALTSALAGSQAIKRAGDMTPAQAEKRFSVPPPPAPPVRDDVL